MTGLDAHTQQIIMLAWSRILGLEDTELQAAPPGERIEAVDDVATSVQFLQLFGRTVLYGPADILAEARDIPDEELTLESRLLDTTRTHAPGARMLGESHLLYCEEPPEVEGSEHVAVSFEPDDAQRLSAVSPADDVARSGLTDTEWSATAVREATGEPLAAASREVWQHVLGHLGILAHPDHRGLGLARFIAAVAVQEAFIDGLVPQWRAAAEAPGSLRMAISLGFTQAGHHTTVALS